MIGSSGQPIGGSASPSVPGLSSIPGLDPSIAGLFTRLQPPAMPTPQIQQGGGGDTQAPQMMGQQQQGQQKPGQQQGQGQQDPMKQITGTLGKLGGAMGMGKGQGKPGGLLGGLFGQNPGSPPGSTPGSDPINGQAGQQSPLPSWAPPSTQVNGNNLSYNPQPEGSSQMGSFGQPTGPGSGLQGFMNSGAIDAFRNPSSTDTPSTPDPNPNGNAPGFDLGNALGLDNLNIGDLGLGDLGFNLGDLF